MTPAPPTRTGFSTAEEVADEFLAAFEEIRIAPQGCRYEEVGKKKLRGTVLRMVERGEVLRAVLPAFPMKAPNMEKKVLGKLPDRGEEFALHRLEGLARRVEAVYEGGVEVVIFSDGRVFSDLLGVTDAEVAEYGKELKRMAETDGLTHIRFDSLEEHTRTEKPIEELLERYDCLSVDIDALVKEDHNAAQLCCAFAMVVLRDMEEKYAGMSKRGAYKAAKEVAKKMMHRNMAFSKLVDEVWPEAVRLSIHAHDCAGPKYGVYLLPKPPQQQQQQQEETQKKAELPGTPWHNVVCEDVDGTVRCMKKENVDAERYVLYTKYGRPWGYRQRRAEAEAEVETKAVGCDAVNDGDAALLSRLPAGSQVRCITGPSGKYSVMVVEVVRSSTSAAPPPLESVDKDVLRGLALRHGTVVLRGFRGVQDEDAMEATARHVGDVCPWPAGAVLKVRHAPQTGLPSMTRDPLPMHWDGMFKVASDGSIGDVPAFQVFHCVEAYPDPADPNNGRTLFTDTRPIVKLLCCADDEEEEEKKEASASPTTTTEEGFLKAVFQYYHPQNPMFGHDDLRLTQPALCPHPLTGETIFRFAEPWNNEEGTDLTEVHLLPEEGEDDIHRKEREAKLFGSAKELIYSPRFCYSHAWQKGDYVVADNFANLHARTSLKDDGRVLMRVHVN